MLSRAEGDAGGEFVAARVDRTYVRVSDHLRKLAVRDSTGALQEFATTDEHPFWVEGLDWVNAGDIAPGQTLLQSDRGEARVEATEYDWRPAGVPVYNFRVEGLHTYFVAAPGIDGPAILVHNANKYSNDSAGGEEHDSNQRESNRNKHEEGEVRKQQDRGGEKGDKRRGYPRRRPRDWVGKWPPTGE